MPPSDLSPLFDQMDADSGRPSIPPERLLNASLLIALYSVRSERAFCEELEFNLLFRWFLDMSLMELSFAPTSFTKNRQRLLDHDVAARFFDAVVGQADDRGLLSDEHFTVDGTLIEAAASLKSFGPSALRDDPGNPMVTFWVERRSNATQAGTTESEWMKSVGGLRRTRFRVLAQTRLVGHLVATAYNLVRMRRLVTMRPSIATG